MSDFSIPGVSSKYNTENMIEKLMEAERVPLERMEESVSTYKDMKQVWQDVNRKISTFRESARTLYGFQSPFGERVANSSNESVITATATREAIEDSKSIVVKQKASADRFLSRSLPRDFTVPAGTYGFQVGEETVTIDFKGGNLEEFATRLSKQGKNIINANVVNDTSTTQVILIEALKTGKENQLVFLDKSKELGVKTGILGSTSRVHYDIPLTENRIRAWEQDLSKDFYSITDRGLVVKPGGEFSIALDQQIQLRENLILEFDVNVTSVGEKQKEPPSPPPGPSIPEAGSTTFEDITIQNKPSQVELPQWEPPPAPKIVEDMTVLYAKDSGPAVPLPDLPESGSKTVQVKLADYLDSISSLRVRNRNTNREITLSNVRIYDPEARGEYKPLNPIAEASDAILSIDGIDVRRNSNDIDDVIPGVTLNVHKADDQPVEMEIQPDRESIKDSIISFIGHYNRMIADFNILTRNEERIIDNLDYFSEEERSEAQERLGLLQGDMTLVRLKNQLQRFMMDPYETGEDSTYNLLAQIGISTNANRASASRSITPSKLLGYLEIDEKVLDKALQNNLESVKRLFGYDSDGDMVVDTGVAYTTENYTRTYSQSGGIVATKLDTLDTRIARTSREIEDYNRYLEDKEQELQRKYGRMEETLNSLEQSSQSIQNLRNNTGRGQQ